jgi:hypothetical protein
MQCGICTAIVNAPVFPIVRQDIMEADTDKLYLLIAGAALVSQCLTPARYDMNCTIILGVLIPRLWTSTTLLWLRMSPLLSHRDSWERPAAAPPSIRPGFTSFTSRYNTRQRKRRQRQSAKIQKEGRKEDDDVLLQLGVKRLTLSAAPGKRERNAGGVET